MKKILIVDDEKYARFLYMEILGKNYEFTEVEDGIEAIEELESDTYDLALVDLNLPFIRGEEVIKQVIGKLKKTKIVIISALKQEELIKELTELGIVGLITKPINDIKELKESVKKWCE
ncbi:response regulator [Haliovirga abyssi]|uniref:Response regulator n=1 Tax=Haliovirga abyssi TaxID=2996794 RepID=A0AAU9DYW1_9FUSO|nr:response regulator [Haliovirga abyssi]BDU50645.1 response regulator [Haliovirga abyssi]